jgi:hypothetical protein
MFAIHQELVSHFIAPIRRDRNIPKHKLATPFCAFKTLTGFGF